MAARIAIIGCLAALLCGFVPYEHEGTLGFTVGGNEVRGRALFSSSAAQQPGRVLVYADFPLPTGGEGFLTLEVTLPEIGREAQASWTYYEKLSPGVVSFDATAAEGLVILADRYELGQETSMYLEFEVLLTDGAQQRLLTDAYALTTPSPAVLRGSGRLPRGVVTHYGAQPADRYHRGTIDCYGEPDDVVVVDEYVVEEIIEEEEIIVVVDGSGGRAGPDDPPIDDGVTDDEYEYEEVYYEEYDTSSSEGFDCGGDDTDTDTSDSESSSGPECEGDAMAASPATARFLRAPLPGRDRSSQVLATRLMQLSPMLLLLAGLLLLRRSPRDTPAPRRS